MSDRGKEFVNKAMQAVLGRNGIQTNLMPAYYHRSNGLVERLNRTIISILRRTLYEEGGSSSNRTTRIPLPSINDISPRLFVSFPSRFEARACFRALRCSRRRWVRLFLVFVPFPVLQMTPALSKDMQLWSRQGAWSHCAMDSS